MNRATYIYKITSPSGKIYIGSTFDISNRKRHYSSLQTKSQAKLHNSLLKYGWTNHIFEVIEECNEKNRNKRESYWGNYFNVLSKDNLNCKLPKGEEIFSCISEETRKKMSEWQIGRIMSKESREKMSNKAKGKIVSEKTRLAASNFHSKAICQYDLEGNFIREWKSASEVQKTIKINSGHIRSCCLNNRKTAGGFKWKNK